MTAEHHPRGYVDQLLESLDNAGIGLIVVGDQSGRFERWYANRTVCAIFGRSPDELAATPVLAAVPASEQARLIELRDRLNAGDSMPPLVETEVVRPDGSRLPVEIAMARFPDGDGWATIAFLRDISRRRRTQTALLEADRMAAIGALAAGVAHEINNPLTYVLLHLSNLRRSMTRWAVPAEHDHMSRVLDDMVGGAERMRGIVRDLLAFAAPGPASASVDVTEVVAGVLKLVTPTLKHRTRVVAELGAAPRVGGDPGRLGQAVLNMVLNASSGFAGDDPHHNELSVVVGERDGAAVIDVADNGVPVAEPDLDRAFEPFFHLRDGHGVGLAVTRSIAEAMKGEVVATRQPGGGLTVSLRLPASR